MSFNKKMLMDLQSMIQTLLPKLYASSSFIDAQLQSPMTLETFGTWLKCATNIALSICSLLRLLGHICVMSTVSQYQERPLISVVRDVGFLLSCPYKNLRHATFSHPRAPSLTQGLGPNSPMKFQWHKHALMQFLLTSEYNFFSFIGVAQKWPSNCLKLKFHDLDSKSSNKISLGFSHLFHFYFDIISIFSRWHQF